MFTGSAPDSDAYAPARSAFQEQRFLSALRDDHVGTALARLYKLLVHRFYGRQVLRYNAVQGTAALFYIAQDPAENPHVRIGIDKDFDVHQIAEILLNEEENALEHDNRAGWTRIVLSERLYMA